MREINVNEITKTVKELCMEANYFLSDDIKEALENNRKKESWALAGDILEQIIINGKIAAEDRVPRYRNGLCIFRSWTRYTYCRRKY